MNPPSDHSDKTPPAGKQDAESIAARRAKREQRIAAGGGAGVDKPAGPDGSKQNNPNRAGQQKQGGGGPNLKARQERQQLAHAKAAEPISEPVYIAPPAPPARAKRRHWGLLFSFFLFVVGPIAVAGWYLWERAAPRYVSYAGFSVRTEEAGSATDFLGNISALSGSSSSDTDILYNFIRSQEMVRIVDETLDIRALWSKADPDVDPIFAYHAPGNIEDLTAYWGRMVKVYNDDGSGLIDMAVQAFSPQDATRIAEVIYDESSKMINRLSSIARDDAIAYAREELTTAEENLRKARLEITRFRNVNQIVDPSVSIQGQAGLLASLEAQLAETLIDLDILKDTARANDPRIVALERRFDAINARIEEERKRVGVNDDGDGFADLVDQYESLSIDLKFTEETYTVARAAFASALAEARRQNRYLAAHVRPTSAESAEHPERYSILALVALFAFLAWVLCVLSSYAIKDRR
ncbi:MAG: capsular polysaccharide transport system permease protein [Gammaproteobacteria bacterium]